MNDPQMVIHPGTMDNIISDPRDALINSLRAEVEGLRDTIDTLEMHALRDVAPGWVSVPEVEWDAALAAGRVGK